MLEQITDQVKEGVTFFIPINNKVYNTFKNLMLTIFVENPLLLLVCNKTTFPLFYYFSSEEQGLELITLCIELITFFYIFSVTSCNTCNLFIKTKSFVNQRKTLIH